MKQKQPTNCFAFFHQNEALLYQFFLHECIATCFLVKKTLSADLLKQLMGCSPTQLHSLQGHLPKMLHYYDLQKANFDPQPLMNVVGTALKQAYLAGQECIELIEKDSKEHKKSYRQLRREIKKIGKLLFGLLPLYKDNPHVLYFVLCRHKQLDTLYGKAVSINLLNSLFEGGLPEFETFLSEKFARKGFHHLLPNIQKHLETMHNE